MDIKPLNWRSEKSLTAYPLQRGIGVEDFLIDANFVQFDGFVPVLNTIGVSEENIVLTVTFDTGRVQLTIPNTVSVGEEFKLYSNTRYLGKLVVGAGVVTMWSKYTGQTLTLNVPFLPSLVRAVPSSGGVYAINGVFGNVQLVSDGVITFDVSGNNVVFNAAAIGNTPLNALKTINGVSPVGNNITINDTTLLKVTTNGLALVVNLVDPGVLGPILRSE